MMELPTGARRRLLDVPAVRGYVQEKVHKFQLWDHVDQTGGRAVVVGVADGWAQPDRVQTSQYPLMWVHCWADCSRDSDTREKLAEDAEDNAWALYRVVDPVFHRRRNEMWGSTATADGAYVVDSVRWQEPFSMNRNPRQGGLPYAVEFGESAVVVVQYAVHLA